MWPHLQHSIFYEAPEVTPPAPGTGDGEPQVDDEQTPPGAEPVVQTDPGPVPYARFREVNEAKKAAEEAIQPFQELTDLGYDADNLHRLVQWEQEAQQDPVGWAINFVKDNPNLDPRVKAAIEEAVKEEPAETPPAGEPPTDQTPKEDDAPPTWAKPIVEDYEARAAAEAQRVQSEAFDAILSAWDKLDADDDISTPKTAKLAYMMSAANAGAVEPIEILRTAREDFLASREEILTGVVTPALRNGETAPRTVPGGGGGTTVLTPAPAPKTLDEARKMAEEAEARGGLVMTWDE